MGEVYESACVRSGKGDLPQAGRSDHVGLLKQGSVPAGGRKNPRRRRDRLKIVGMTCETEGDYQRVETFKERKKTT